ncbi:MAG TPA: hypothetical protein VMU20_17540 [Candidatus Dormibacteraeota bacterium]|nr:hypothetical protein [Candidatus Dormibacteraeota bacterium]
MILTILRSEWDRAAALAALAVGIAAMINGWVGVSGTAYSAEQMPYVVGGGLVGIFLLGVAAVLWLSADMRDEWRKLADLDDRLGRLESRTADRAAPARELPGQPMAVPANGIAQPAQPVGWAG